MNIASRLSALKYIDIKIKSKRQEIENLKSAILKGQVYSDEPKGSKQGNATEDLNIKIIDGAEKIRGEINQLMEERTRLINAIEDLDDPLENIVLRLMYVNGYSWQETKRELNYSHATIQRARAKAIEHLVIKDEPTFNK
nr:MAG TPA: Protein of unknown function (DUF722) [Caudoviricetes sp.]